MLSTKYNEISKHDEINFNNEKYNIVATFNEYYMLFKPKKIILGIGSRANISKKRFKSN